MELMLRVHNSSLFNALTSLDWIRILYDSSLSTKSFCRSKREWRLSCLPLTNRSYHPIASSASNVSPPCRRYLCRTFSSMRGSPEATSSRTGCPGKLCSSHDTYASGFPSNSSLALSPPPRESGHPQDRRMTSGAGSKVSSSLSRGLSNKSSNW